MLYVFYKEYVGPNACINQPNKESNSVKESYKCD